MDLTALLRLGLSRAAAQTYLALLRNPVDLDDLEPEVVGELTGQGLAHTTGRQLCPDSARPALEGWARQRQGEIDSMRGAAESLARAFERRPGGGRDAIDLVHGAAAVGAQYDEMVRQARRVVRGLDRGPYINDVDSPGAEQRAAMGRGVGFQVIYESAALGDQGSQADLLACVAAGEDARVLPRLPMKLIIADESMAMIAMTSTTGSGEALLVRPSMLLEALLELFDQLWEMALPTGSRHDDASMRQLLMLLAAGLTDESIARELGISVRTVQRRLAQLQTTVGATTRLQLGLQLGRRGWL